MGPCNGRPARTRGSSAGELFAEVQAFLLVGDARRELASEREPAPPRAAAVPHRDLRLLRLRATRRTRARASRRAFHELRRDTVADHVEEPGVAARGVDLGRPVRHASRAALRRREHVDRPAGCSRVSLEQRSPGRAEPEVADREATRGRRARHAAQVARLGARRHRNADDATSRSRSTSRRSRCTTFCRNTVPTATHRVGARARHAGEARARRARRVRARDDSPDRAVPPLDQRGVTRRRPRSSSSCSCTSRRAARCRASPSGSGSTRSTTRAVPPLGQRARHELGVVAPDREAIGGARASRRPRARCRPRAAGSGSARSTRWCRSTARPASARSSVSIVLTK